MGKKLHKVQEVLKKFIAFEKSKKGILATASVCLVLLFAFSAVSYTRYYANQNNGSDANIAVFDVSDDLADLDMFVTVGNAPIVVQVVNKSEVKIRYSIQVDNLTGNLPLEFGCPEQLIAANTTDPTDYVITVSFREGTTNTAQYSGMVDCVRLKVVAEQVQT
jgi:hypothetical protein